MLGLFSEDPIERLHHQHLVDTRRVCNIRDYEKRERYLWHRQAAIDSFAAQKVLNETNAKRKRNFSVKSTEKRNVILGKADKKLSIKIEKAEAFIYSAKY